MIPTYRKIITHDSNRARARRRNFSMSVTMVRGKGEPAGKISSPAVIRSMRSRYTPHIGKKHAAKLARRKTLGITPNL